MYIIHSLITIPTIIHIGDHIIVFIILVGVFVLLFGEELITIMVIMETLILIMGIMGIRIIITTVIEM